MPIHVAKNFEGLVIGLPNSEAIPLRLAKDVVLFFSRAINLLHPDNPWQPSPISVMPDGFYQFASRMGLIATSRNTDASLVLITDFGKEIAQRVQEIFE